jgi:hypothetical protein
MAAHRPSVVISFQNGRYLRRAVVMALPAGSGHWQIKDQGHQYGVALETAPEACAVLSGMELRRQ